MIEPLTDALARKTIEIYVCSMCWGDLEIHPDPIEQDKNYVVCEQHQEETRGYVTRYYADRRRNDSEFEKLDVVCLLRRMGILPPLTHTALRPGETGEQRNIRELGF